MMLVSCPRISLFTELQQLTRRERAHRTNSPKSGPRYAPPRRRMRPSSMRCAKRIISCPGRSGSWRAVWHRSTSNIASSSNRSWLRGSSEKNLKMNLSNVSVLCLFGGAVHVRPQTEACYRQTDKLAYADLSHVAAASQASASPIESRRQSEMSIASVSDDSRSSTGTGPISAGLTAGLGSFGGRWFGGSARGSISSTMSRGGSQGA